MRFALALNLYLFANVCVYSIASADLAPQPDAGTRHDSESELDDQIDVRWLSGVALGGGFGRTSIPYAPPFTANYDLDFRYNSLSIDALSFDLRRQSLEDAVVGLAVVNYYPSAGREFDAQLLSLLHLDLQLMFRKKFQLSEDHSLLALVGGQVKYERMTYPKGHVGLSGFPLLLGTQAIKTLRFLELPQALQFDWSSEFLLGAKTAVDFRYDGANESSSGEIITFMPNQPVSGVEHRAVLTYAFAQRPGLYTGAGSDFQHNISIHWATRRRELSEFLRGTSSSGATLRSSDVELDAHEWGVTWSEKF